MMSSLGKLRMLVILCLAGIPAALAQSPIAGDSPDASDIVVRLKRDGETIVIDVEMAVPASPRAVWDVLTDYDHMAQFMGNVQASRVTDRHGNTLTVAQTSGTTFGLLKFSFENTREVELVPRREIRSIVISGDMKASAYTTRILGGTGAVTRVINHGEFVPTMWVPPVIGDAFLQTETRRQFSELRREMLRRVAAGEGGAPAIQ